MQRDKDALVEVAGIEVFSPFKIECLVVRHRLLSGDMSYPLKRKVFSRGDSAAILLYHEPSDSVVLFRQYRAGAFRDPSPWKIEVVAGIIEDGDTPDEAACREASEEAGVTPEEVEHILTFYPSPGGCTERVFLYLGKILNLPEALFGGLQEEGEDVEIMVTPFDKQ